jgi:uncharacterized protein (UPF0248 family)
VVYPREVLNKLRWTKGESIQEATIVYVHRGAPGDIASVKGSEITQLRTGFFETRDSTIPYHRILKIEYRGKTIFDKTRERGM